MLRVFASAGLTEDKVLSIDISAPKVVDSVFALATDGVIHFSKSSERSSSRIARLDVAFHKHGVERHPKKDVDTVLDGRCLGVDLTGGTKLSPAADSFGHLLCCCAFVAASPDDFLMTPLQLASLMGLAQWYCLLNRPLLSVFNESYAFVRKQPGSLLVLVPVAVKHELLLFVCLSIYL